ncbi:hypothetical protein OHA40_15485 [Nocardia sp. NBC_00508]|uniref:hypothetical protein n=1 Tax=Nocardia sp. NBC_00508 TaxID=2975992 RepID=UPI002E814A4C|nr:hypothetical protein [Nocardia sp. NBC_00508]WUD69401.1 hypothetical protein OHA40_15485 [Nocardia sp. NBC_00508]
MNEIEYVFGTGDGPVHVWTSPADLELGDTGAADAVRLDFDGDGSADDALWDSSGSGVADIAALDLDDDGVLDHFFTDPTGLGTWNHQVTGLPTDAASEPLDWIVRTEQEAPDRLVDGAEPADVLSTQPDSDHSAALADALPHHLAHWLSRDGRTLGDEPFIA